MLKVLLQISLLVALAVNIQFTDAKDSQVHRVSKTDKENDIIELTKIITKAITIPKPKTCDPVSKCVVKVDTPPVCGYDEVSNCIRKYASECHLKIAACKAGKALTDYNNVYCSMEAYLCEDDYERWTIFFGHEKI